AKHDAAAREASDEAETQGRHIQALERMEADARRRAEAALRAQILEARLELYAEVEEHAELREMALCNALEEHLLALYAARQVLWLLEPNGAARDQLPGGRPDVINEFLSL